MLSCFYKQSGKQSFLIKLWPRSEHIPYPILQVQTQRLGCLSKKEANQRERLSDNIYF